VAAKMRAIAAASVLAACGLAQAADYAVLAATSNGYYNYRHQADVAHAYQVLVEGGIPAKNIITFMYDDVAGSSENPFPGKLFNAPTPKGTPGRDVYAGVKIDYKGKDVSAANFLSVLKGDASAMKGKGTGRVLTSGKKDRVFVNIVDHGAPGLVAFPSTTLYKEDLQSALEYMHTNKMFKQLVFYLEACESGSMFEDLPTDINVYVTTAANAKESSWGTYCGSDAMVDGKNLNSCLGDLYSVNWMQNADSSNLQTETLEQQYTAVKKLTNKSHVMQYGATSKIPKEPAANFEGSETRNVTHTVAQPGWASTTVPSRDIKLHSLFTAYLNAPSEKRAQAAAAVKAEIAHREEADALFERIAKKAANGREVLVGAPLKHRACHREADATVAEYCGGYSDYSRRHVRTMIDVCEALGGDADAVVAAIRSEC